MAGAHEGPVIAELQQLGLLGPAPAPLTAGVEPQEVIVELDEADGFVCLARHDLDHWPGARTLDAGVPLARCLPTPRGWVVSNAGNSVPTAFEPDVERARAELVALVEALSVPIRPWLWLPLVVVERTHDAVLISPSLLADPMVRSRCAAHGDVSTIGMAKLVGTRPSVISEVDRDAVTPVTGLILDRTWSGINPEAVPLMARWIVACLLAAANSVVTAGRYALLDAAQRLADQPVALVGLEEAESVVGLLRSAPVGPR